MHSRKYEKTLALEEAEFRGKPSALLPIGALETALAGPDEATSASAGHGAPYRTSGPADGCLFCRYRSPGLGKDGMNA